MDLSWVVGNKDSWVPSFVIRLHCGEEGDWSELVGWSTDHSITIGLTKGLISQDLRERKDN